MNAPENTPLPTETAARATPRVDLTDTPAAMPRFTDQPIRQPMPQRAISSTVLADGVGRELGRVSRFFDAPFVEQLLNLSRTTGHYAVLAGAGLTLLSGIYVAIKVNAFGLLLSAIALAVGIAVAHFAAQRFLTAAEGLITQSPSSVSSMAFLECTGLLSMLLALTILVGGIVGSIQLSSLVPLIPAVFVAAVLTCLGAVALHPELVAVGIGRGTAGEEAVGLLSFFAKAWLKIVPVIFCLLAVGGCVALIAGMFEAGAELSGSITAVAGPLGSLAGVPYQFAGGTVVMLAALVPFLAYAGFVLQYLGLDIARAILAVPGKLDLMRK